MANKDFYVGQIFEGSYPPDAAIACNQNGWFIKDIGDHRYEIQAQPEPTEYEKAQERISVLKAEIDKVDYKQFKYLRGELTAEEWEEVKAYIQARTAEINELELVVDQTEVKDTAA